MFAIIRVDVLGKCVLFISSAVKKWRKSNEEDRLSNAVI